MVDITLDDVLDEYGKELQIVKTNYLMVGKLLNKKMVCEHIESTIEGNIYIYGAETMGILTYEAIKDSGKVLGIIDRSGGIRGDFNYIPVVDIDGFRKKYNGETVIITLGYHYMQVVSDLKEFVPMEKMLYIGEVIGDIG